MRSAVARQVRQPAAVLSMLAHYAEPVVGVEPVFASKRECASLEPDRNPLKRPRNVSATGALTSWAFEVWTLVAHACHLRVSAIPSVITNEFSSLAFLVDLADGALALIVESLKVWSFGLAARSWPSRLRLGRFGRIDQSGRAERE